MASCTVMITLAAAAGFAAGVLAGALTVLALANRIRPPLLPDRRPAPTIVQLYIDDDNVMRRRHPSYGVRLTDTTPADLELVRDTRTTRTAFPT